MFSSYNALDGFLLFTHLSPSPSPYTQPSSPPTPHFPSPSPQPRNQQPSHILWYKSKLQITKHTDTFQSQVSFQATKTPNLEQQWLLQQGCEALERPVVGKHLAWDLQGASLQHKEETS